MKKIILGSLVAMMAVTAANAEIASVKYVDDLVAEKEQVVAEENLDKFVTTVARVDKMIGDSHDTLVAEKEEVVATENLDKFVPTVARVDKMIGDSHDTLVAKKDDQVPQGKDDELVPTVARAQLMIDNSQSDLSAIIGDTSEFGETDSVMGFVNANTGNIATNAQAIENEASARATADSTLDDKISANTGNITTNTNAIAAINHAETGILATAAKTYQEKSEVLSIGDENGNWLDLTKVTGYSATGTHSLVLKDGNIQWEAIRY